MSSINDNRQQSVPAEGVAGLLDRLTNLKDLTLHLHKRAEVVGACWTQAVGHIANLHVLE